MGIPFTTLNSLSCPREGLDMARQRTKKPVRYYSPKRRALYAQGDDIDALVLFQMHAWICHVCRERINPKIRKPSYWAATIEHKIPLSKGGTHTWDNCAPAHAICNFTKGDSLPEQGLDGLDHLC